MRQPMPTAKTTLHPAATCTTDPLDDGDAIRQPHQASLRALSKRYGINPKTVAKWRQRTSVADQRTGPKDPRLTVLSPEQEAIVVAFRRHTLLPLDDCLYARAEAVVERQERVPADKQR